jgi:hypothetical protein
VLVLPLLLLLLELPLLLLLKFSTLSVHVLPGCLLEFTDQRARRMGWTSTHSAIRSHALGIRRRPLRCFLRQQLFQRCKSICLDALTLLWCDC